MPIKAKHLNRSFSLPDLRQMTVQLQDALAAPTTSERTGVDFNNDGEVDAYIVAAKIKKNGRLKKVTLESKDGSTRVTFNPKKLDRGLRSVENKGSFVRNGLFKRISIGATFFGNLLILSPLALLAFAMGPIAMHRQSALRKLANFVSRLTGVTFNNPNA